MVLDNNFMLALGGGFSGFMFDILIWVAVVVGVGGFGYWWYINKMLYKYTFIEWFNEKNFRVRKARIIKVNGQRKFQIKEYNDPIHYLTLNQPNGFINGNPCRNVCWDGEGNLTYLEGKTINKDKYLETALKPIERTEAIDAQMESIQKGLNMSTAMKWGMGIVTIIVIMLMITIVMVAKYAFEQTSSITTATHHLVTTSENQKATQEIIRSNTIASNNLAAVYAKMFNVTINQEIGTS